MLITAEYSDGESDTGMKRFNAINQYIITTRSEKCLTHRASWRGAFVNNFFLFLGFLGLDQILQSLKVLVERDFKRSGNEEELLPKCRYLGIDGNLSIGSTTLKISLIT
jgi:hypothetical protein